MQGFGEKRPPYKKKNKNKNTENIMAKMLNQAFKFHSEGKISDAVRSYEYCLSRGVNDYRFFTNYGLLLRDLGKFEKAENFLRKAIEIKPDISSTYSNLAVILRSLGKLEEAENLLRKAIEIKPEFAMAYSNLGNVLKDLGKLEEAENFQRKAIEIDSKLTTAYFNLGLILKDLGKLEEAETILRKAIEIKPDFVIAYLNLGNTLKDLGKLEEAENFLRKAITLNPNFARAYYSLSTLIISTEHLAFYKYLFSKDILNKKNDEEKIDIFFARANILHIQKKYYESSKLLQKANNLKLKLKPFNPEYLIKKSKNLLIESNKQIIDSDQTGNNYENIFIIGMPRSGTTLVESIISINKNVLDLGETNILEESFLESKKDSGKKSLAEVYINKIKRFNSKLTITTNKWLYNYLYAGIIANQLPNSKIIYCFRNPLDNILSIYRAHFRSGNEYASSLKDCANVYLHHEEIINDYIKQNPLKIYKLNYDELVIKPEEQIKLLVNWLGWKWENAYLKPHKNPRSVRTASNVQIRSPINSKSIGGWRNYKNILEPALEILIKNEKYQDLID